MSKKIEKNKSIIRKVELPYPGEIFVKNDQEVEPDTLVAKTELVDIQPGYFDVANLFNLNAESNEMKDVWQVEPQSFVNRGDVLAKYKEQEVKAPYYGYVEHISKSGGYLLLRQKVSQDEEPLVIEAAKEIGISNKALANVLQVKVGDHVLRGSGLAGDVKLIKTPMTGEVVDISIEKGTISIKPYYKPTSIYAGIYGIVREVEEPLAVNIETEVDLVKGMFGIGQDRTGELFTKGDQVVKNGILFIDGQATKDDLLKAERDDLSGLIAASANAEDLMNYFGNEITEGVTGLVNKPISIILLEGFGKKKTSQEIIDLLASFSGKKITINPSTNVQTPVKKPEIYLYKNQ